MATVNIIPMAGTGSRFADAGYMLPKALIPVSGKPMILGAIEHMPKADTWVFIVRKEHIDQYFIDTLIKQEIPDAIIVSVDQTTEGQASTCMLAMPHVKPDDSIFIAACDNSFLYNHEQYNALIADQTNDAIVWTFTKDPLLTISPKSWGWIRLEADGVTIDDMSVKVPVSETPFNDHAVVATFWFRKAQDFIDAYDLMVKENYRINNEFYVDSLPIFFKKLSKKSVIFDVDLYVGWGKPSDLYLFEYNEYLNSVGKLEDSAWKKYFSL
jgi:dTDP-glucose pyrophosphorylase